MVDKMIKKIKALLFRFHLQLERNSKLYFLTLATLYLIILVGYFLQSNNIFSESLKSRLNILILLLILIIFASNYLYIRVIKTQRSNLAVRKRILQKYITDEELNYRVSRRSERHEIYENGSGCYMREVDVHCTEGSVHRYDVTLSSTNPIPIAMDHPQFSFKAYLNPGKHQLDNFVIKLGDRDRVHAVPFPEPLNKRNHTAFLQIEVDWPGIWTDFTVKGADTGSFKIAHKTERFTLELVAPKSMRFTRFSIDPKIGNFNILTPNDIQSKIFFSVDNPPFGNYEYRIEGEKNPKPFFRLLGSERERSKAGMQH